MQSRAATHGCMNYRKAYQYLGSNLKIMSLNIIKTFCTETQHVTEITDMQISRACSSIIKAMKDELPAEAHSIEVFDYILENSKETLRSMPIKLQ